MNITSKIIASGLLICSAALSGTTFANNDQAKAKAEFETMMKDYKAAVDSALKSSDVRGGLIKACGVQYKKTVSEKMLTQADVTKLCTCTVDAEGRVTEAQKWDLQSAANAKNQSKFQQLQTAILKSQGESVKKCVGTTLDKKINDLAQKAVAQHKAATAK